jgi:hypothetical protein
MLAREAIGRTPSVDTADVDPAESVAGVVDYLDWLPELESDSPLSTLRRGEPAACRKLPARARHPSNSVARSASSLWLQTWPQRRHSSQREVSVSPACATSRCVQDGHARTGV